MGSELSFVLAVKTENVVIWDSTKKESPEIFFRFNAALAKVIKAY